MAEMSYRCSQCGINYPMNSRFRKCLVCLADTSSIQADPDEDWNESVIFAKEHLTSAERQQVKGEVMLYTEDGFTWIDSHDLIRAGYGDRIPTFQILELKDGTLVEVNGRQESKRRYWVDVLRPPRSSADVDASSSAVSDPFAKTAPDDLPS